MKHFKWCILQTKNGQNNYLHKRTLMCIILIVPYAPYLSVKICTFIATGYVTYKGVVWYTVGVCKDD